MAAWKKMLFCGSCVFLLLLVRSTLSASLNGTQVPGNDEIEIDLESGTKIPMYYMNDNCNKVLMLHTRNPIRIAPWSTKYPPAGQDCVVKVQETNYPTYRLVVTFKQMKMSAGNSRGTCSSSRLDLYTGSSASTSSRISGPDGICGTKPPFEEYTTTGNMLTMRYTTNSIKPKTYEYFESVLTPYHLGTCRHDEFKCKNGRCVQKDLLCNGYNNCGDDSDEKSCAALLLSVAAIAAIVVGCVVVIGIICSIVICKCCCGACGYERF